MNTLPMVNYCSAFYFTNLKKQIFLYPKKYTEFPALQKYLRFHLLSLQRWCSCCMMRLCQETRTLDMVYYNYQVKIHAL